MARRESDRDDLYAELAAAGVRWELRVSSWDRALVAGIRSDDRFSIYFGPDRCYHFDRDGGLRRAYVSGRLYRTQGTTLARLIRNRSPSSTQLMRHDLDAAELAEFLAEMRAQLRHLRDRLDEGAYQILRAHPDEDSVRVLSTRLAACLSSSPPLAVPYPTRRS